MSKKEDTSKKNSSNIKSEVERQRDPFDKIISFLTSHPTYLPIVITAIYYMVIANYYINYFNRLSLPFFTLNLPLSFYLSSGYHILNITLLLLLLMLYYLELTEHTHKLRNNSKYFTLFLNSLLVFIFMPLIIIGIVSMTLPYDFLQNNLYILVVMILLFCFLITQLRKMAKKKDFNKIDCIITILIFIFFVVAPPSIFGEIAAQSLIKGESDNFQVRLDLKDKNTSIPNNTFILVSQNNGNYYLIEKNNLPAKSTKLYVIPEKKIKSILMEHNLNSSNNTLFKVISDKAHIPYFGSWI